MNNKEILAKLKTLPKAEQKVVWRKCKFDAFKSRHTWLGFLAYMILMIAGTIVGEVFDLRVRRVNWPFLVGVFAGMIVFVTVWHHQLCKHAKKYL